ncbi:MAG: helix-turn-helix domain-containing protein, partial [Vicinamibacteraceae bacterium]
MQRAKRDYTIDVVVRGLVILETLAMADRDLGVLELSEIVKIPVSTVYRLLSTLQSRGCVEKNLETDKYRLGIRLFELGMARIKRPEYRSFSIALRALQSEINETVFVGIIRENEVLIIDEFSQYRGIVFSSQPG